MVGRKKKSVAFNFMPKEENIPYRTIFGSISQNDSKFGVLKNTQCTSMSVMAIFMAKKINISDWNTGTIDQVLNLGNDLHWRSIEQFKGTVPDPPYLCADEICLQDLLVEENNIILSCNPVTTNFEMQGYININLEGVLNIFFENYSYGVFTSQLKSCALIKENEEFWVFDPHTCNTKCLHSDSGVAVAYCYTNILNLRNTIIENLKKGNINEPFTITPFIFTQKNINDQISEQNSQISKVILKPMTENVAFDSNSKNSIPILNLRKRKGIVQEKIDFREYKAKKLKKDYMKSLRLSRT